MQVSFQIYLQLYWIDTSKTGVTMMK